MLPINRAQDNDSKKPVALKKFFPHGIDSYGFPHSSLREINLLISLQHINIVNVDEVVVGKEKTLKDTTVFMVMEFVEHDIKTLMSWIKKNQNKSRPFTLVGFNYIELFLKYHITSNIIILCWKPSRTPLCLWWWSLWSTISRPWCPGSRRLKINRGRLAWYVWDVLEIFSWSVFEMF